MLIKCHYCKREFDKPSHRNQHERDAHKQPACADCVTPNRCRNYGCKTQGNQLPDPVLESSYEYNGSDGTYPD